LDQIQDLLLPVGEFGAVEHGAIAMRCLAGDGLSFYTVAVFLSRGD
jgi:hypothetical protein